MGKDDKKLHYKNKSIRLAEKTWEQLQDKRKRINKTWNLFLLDLLKSHEKKQKGFGEKNSSN